MITLGLQWPRQADDDDDDDGVVLPQEHRLAPNDKASNMCLISVSLNPTVSLSLLLKELLAIRYH